MAEEVPNIALGVISSTERGDVGGVAFENNGRLRKRGAAAPLFHLPGVARGGERARTEVGADRDLVEV